MKRDGNQSRPREQPCRAAIIYIKYGKQFFKLPMKIDRLFYIYKIRFYPANYQTKRRIIKFDFIPRFINRITI